MKLSLNEKILLGWLTGERKQNKTKYPYDWALEQINILRALHNVTNNYQNRKQVVLSKVDEVIEEDLGLYYET